MTWVERRGLPQGYESDELLERVLDGLTPDVSAAAIAYDGFVPYWALAWDERVCGTAAWSERTRAATAWSTR